MVGYEENEVDDDCDKGMLSTASNGGKLLSILLLKPIGIDVISRILFLNQMIIQHY